MLALMRDISSNEPRAVQRTALTQALMQAISQTTFAEFKKAGGKVSRMTVGPLTGTAIKLSCDEDVTLGLAIGEGTETVLAGDVARISSGLGTWRHLGRQKFSDP
jgi:hypothetical protein